MILPKVKRSERSEEYIKYCLLEYCFRDYSDDKEVVDALELYHTYHWLANTSTLEKISKKHGVDVLKVEHYGLSYTEYDTSELNIIVRSLQHWWKNYYGMSENLYLASSTDGLRRMFSDSEKQTWDQLIRRAFIEKIRVTQTDEKNDADLVKVKSVSEPDIHYYITGERR